MNTIEDLRASLFDTMRALKDEKNPMDIERARAIGDIAQTIINTAKVEVDHARITGGKGSGFLSTAPALPPAGEGATPTGERTVEQIAPGATRTTHRLRG